MTEKSKKKPRQQRKEVIAPWLHIELGEKGITVGRDTALKHRPFKDALKGVKCGG